MTGDERRRSTRVFFQTIANLHFSDADFSNCETEDLSIKGVFVLGISGRPIGDRCAVQLAVVRLQHAAFARYAGGDCPGRGKGHRPSNFRKSTSTALIT